MDVICSESRRRAGTKNGQRGKIVDEKEGEWSWHALTSPEAKRRKFHEVLLGQLCKERVRSEFIPSHTHGILTRRRSH